MRSTLPHPVLSSVLLVALLVLSACARNISPDVYKASHVGEASNTYAGVIVNARQVLVEEEEYLEKNGLGVAGGGVLGGVLGNQIGGGSGRTIATVGGALAGATAGAYAEKELKKQSAIEYVVKLDNGQLMTIVQGISPVYNTGQRVYVMKSYQGRSRIVSSANY